MRRLLFLLVCLTVAGGLWAAEIPVADGEGLLSALQGATAGDVVRLAAGEYRLSAMLRPASGVKLVGAGLDRTVVVYAGEKPGVMLSLVGVEGNEVADLCLDARGNELVQRVISAYNSKRLSLHHLRICNTHPKNGNPAIHFNGQAKTRLQGTLDSVISDCVFENIGVDSGWGCGIRFSWGSSRNKALRNRVVNTGRGGILADNGSTDLTISGNTISGSNGEGLGIEVWGGCDRCVIEDNTIDHWLSIGGCDWCAVRRNTISEKTGTQKFIGIEGIGSYCLYTDNVVDDGQVIGISVSGSQPKNYAYYANNAARNCLEWGTQFQGEKGGCGYNYFYRCTFEGTTVGRGKLPYPGYEGHGFRVNGDFHHAVFEECRMVNNGRYGVQLGGPRVDFLSFIGCVISGNKGAAVADLRDYTALEWENCKVEGNGSDKLPPAKAFATPRPAATVVGPATVKTGQTVEFTCRSEATRDPETVVLWDTGAGVPQTGWRSRQVYEKPGKYVVTAVLWDKHGRGVRAEKVVEVR